MTNFPSGPIDPALKPQTPPPLEPKKEKDKLQSSTDSIASSALASARDRSSSTSPLSASSVSASPKLELEQSTEVPDEFSDWTIVERQDPLAPDWEVIDAGVEEAASYPEIFKRYFSSVGESIASMFSSLAELCLPSLYTDESYKVKAMKYQSLLETLDIALKNQGLEGLDIPVRGTDLIQHRDRVNEVYCNALDRIREGVGDERYDAVCYALYTQNDLSSANTELLGLLGVKPPTGEGNLYDKLRDANAAVNKAPSTVTTMPWNRAARSIKDALGIYFSPIQAGNPPQKMFTMDINGSKVEILGFGSPTRQNTNAEAAIDPLFTGYLNHLQRHGMKHLYVSNQNALNEENMRNKEIMALAEKYPNTLFVMTQNKNTKFYNSSHAEGTVVRSADGLKRLLHKHFFVEDIVKHGCGVDKNIQDKRELEQFANRALEEIHDRLFDHKKELTKEEEKLFIEMYYNLLTLELLKSEGINYVNFTCKDGIDRGMGSLAWLVMLVEFANGRKENNPITEGMLQNTFFTRAFWTRKRNIIHERFLRPIEDMETLEKLDPDFSKTRHILAPFTVTGIH